MADSSNSNDDTGNGSGDGKNRSRPSSIEEALRTLDEALGGAGANLKDLMAGDFENLKAALSGTAANAGGAVHGMTDGLRDSFGDIGEQAMERFSAYAEEGRRIFSDVDVKVRSNPWPVIGGVAVGTFALGLLLGRTSEPSVESRIDRRSVDSTLDQI
jgi:ElaB/YqjD/DUF883 family membrane-anchored ribosome-binding protein